MAKKFGKFLLLTAAVGTAAAAAYYYMQKKDQSADIPDDEDYDDFSEDFDDNTDASRNYVALNTEAKTETPVEKTESPAAETGTLEEKTGTPSEKDAKENASETQNSFIPLTEKVIKAEESEEFFDEEDTAEDNAPVGEN